MKQFLLKDIHLKVFALLIAGTIWFAATLDRNYVLNRKVPIKFLGLPPTKLIVYQSLEEVNVVLEGKGRDFFLTGEQRLAYEVALKDTKPGRQRLKFNSENLNLKRQLLIRGFKPEYLEFEIDDLREKLVEIKVPLKDELPTGFFLTGVEVKDNKVYLWGPKSELPFITSLATETLSLRGLKESVKKEVSVLVPSKKFWARPDKILVSLTIEQETTREIDSIWVKTDRKGVRIIPKNARVFIAGPPSRIKSITRNDIKVFLTLKDLNPGIYKLPAQILLPPGVIFKRCEPARFQVEIK